MKTVLLIDYLHMDQYGKALSDEHRQSLSFMFSGDVSARVDKIRRRQGGCFIWEES